jgi:DNA-binding NtrC family response regulator
LRDRREDIPLLVQHFLELYAVEMSLPVPLIDREALRRLVDYPFPGNVRELKNIIERAVMESAGGAVGPEHLHFFYAEDRFPGDPRSSAGTDAPEPKRADEERILERVRTHGTINNTECRELLGVERNRASYLLKKLHGSGRLHCEGQGRWANYRLPE